jgi:hypothetical protein
MIDGPQDVAVAAERWLAATPERMARMVVERVQESDAFKFVWLCGSDIHALRST